MATRRSEKVGLPPGALVTVSEGHLTPTTARVFTFNADNCTETDPWHPHQPPPVAEGTVTWVDVTGLGDVSAIQALAEHAGVHALLVEDILNTDQRAKVEEQPEHIFVVAKMLALPKASGKIEVDQVSFVLGRNLLISFQQHPGPTLDSVRQRLRDQVSSLRRKSADYLLYALLDVIVDHYFTVVDTLGDRISTMQRKVVVKPEIKDLKTMLELRSALITVGRHVLPMRELAGRLIALQSPLLDKGTRRYLNDLQDHTVYIAESIAMFRDMVSNLENTYHAQTNARMAQVMRLLTVISTIFIPLTFIVGVYGMNFHHMPELGWRLGYPAVMLFMALLAGGMLLWFRRKGWI